MADKKAVIVLASSAELAGNGKAIGKVLKKGALLTKYAGGEVLNGAVAAEEVSNISPADIAANIEKGTPLMCVDLGGADSAALDAALETILEGIDRRTVLAVAGKDSLAFYGAGIDPKIGKIDRPVEAKDVLPTLAAIGEFSLTAQCNGAVVYQALKNPNPKLEEIIKLKEALGRMEGALARDNREPWDKHDCA